MSATQPLRDGSCSCTWRSVHRRISATGRRGCSSTQRSSAACCADRRPGAPGGAAAMRASSPAGGSACRLAQSAAKSRAPSAVWNSAEGKGVVQDARRYDAAAAVSADSSWSTAQGSAAACCAASAAWPSSEVPPAGAVAIGSYRRCAAAGRAGRLSWALISSTARRLASVQAAPRAGDGGHVGVCRRRRRLAAVAVARRCLLQSASKRHATNMLPYTAHVWCASNGRQSSAGPTKRGCLASAQQSLIKRDTPPRSPKQTETRGRLTPAQELHRWRPAQSASRLLKAPGSLAYSRSLFTPTTSLLRSPASAIAIMFVSATSLRGCGAALPLRAGK